MKSFAEKYQENIKVEQVEVFCPKCKTVLYIFPEHIGRADCETCNVELKIKTKTVKIKSTSELNLKNMALILATASLNETGEYRCILDGQKTHFILER